MKLYDGGTIILITVFLIGFGVYNDIRVAKREKQFWKYAEEMGDVTISSDKPLKIRKATEKELEEWRQIYNKEK